MAPEDEWPRPKPDPPPMPAQPADTEPLAVRMQWLDAMDSYVALLEEHTAALYDWLADARGHWSAGG